MNSCNIPLLNIVRVYLFSAVMLQKLFGEAEHSSLPRQAVTQTHLQYPLLTFQVKCSVDAWGRASREQPAVLVNNALKPLDLDAVD